ncbi:MAG: rubredoxin [Clostridiales bacterium]|nr:rubredoxin [Clostridiales bacterium]
MTCSVCGYVYDEARGLPEAGIAPGTPFEALPEDWVCPLCGADRGAFHEQGAPAAAPRPAPAGAAIEAPEDLRALSPLEVSALCSNLARGCEKQYLAEEAALFASLADAFKVAAAPAAEPGVEALLAMLKTDLEQGFPAANAACAEAGDRGAMRALVWGEKVTRMLNSLLSRYAREGEAMLENTGVYLCTVCGFIYIGDAPPDICPVCKVPNWKFEAIGGRS